MLPQTEWLLLAFRVTIETLNLSRSSFFQPRMSLEVKTGRANGRMQETGPWSEMDGGPTMSSLIAQSERVMITSRIPPCVCAGWFTCCTNPKESRSSWSYEAAGSVGFSKWTFRSPVMINCELNVATVQWRRYTRSCQVKWPGEKANDLAVDLAVKHLGKIIIKDNFNPYNLINFNYWFSDLSSLGIQYFTEWRL